MGGRLIDLSQPKIMGILNVTPDSFYDGARYGTDTEILHQTEKMLQEGATFIDVGGYSSRPGAKDIHIDEERKRSVNAIQLIIKKFPTVNITIDTFRSEVARAAIEAGALGVNDISGGSLDAQMFETIAQLKIPYIMMHMRGDPRNMNSLTEYKHLLKEVTDYFHHKIAILQALGVKDIIIDPGFGFAKTREQNFELLQHLDYLKILGKPILAGLSRKSMIWKTLDIKPQDALSGTIALNTIALLKGAGILRVHDVKPAIEVITLLSKFSA